MRNGRRFGDLCKDFGWSQSEGDKSGNLIHDCAFQCASSFNTNGIICVYRSGVAFSHDSSFSLTSDSSVLSLMWESWPEESGICCHCGCLGQRLVGAAFSYLTEILRNRGAIWTAAGLCEPVGIIQLNHSGSLKGSDLPKSLTDQTLQLDHNVSLLCPSCQILWRVSFSELMS